MYVVSMKKENHRSQIFSILSEFLEMPVSAADLVESKENPRPSFPRLSIDANWTHSGDVCILAFSRECRVGVDFEWVRHRELRVARRFFSGEEVTSLNRLEQSEAIELFFKLWCRKEALYKCVGGSFFEGTLRQSVLEDCVNNVSFININPESLGILGNAEICLAVARKI